MPTRHYFRKGVFARATEKPLPKQFYAHKGRVCLAKGFDGKRTAGGDKIRKQYMSTRDAHHRIGTSKGGQTTQDKGLAHRWTSEEAQAAALKAWATRWRKGPRGFRLGRRLKNSRYLREAERVAIRSAHTSWVRGVRYDPVDKTWWCRRHEVQHDIDQLKIVWPNSRRTLKEQADKAEAIADSEKRSPASGTTAIATTSIGHPGLSTSTTLIPASLPVRRLSERQALCRLGYLTRKGQRRLWIPDSVQVTPQSQLFVKRQHVGVAKQLLGVSSASTTKRDPQTRS